MTEQAQLTKDQVMEIIKKSVVYVDVNDNAVYLSIKKLLSHFLSNTKELDKIIKVSVDNNNEMVVYASAKPTQPIIKSIILKVTLYPNAFTIPGMKYEFVEAGDDVHIKIYVKQDIEQTPSDTNTNSEVDF